MNYAPMQWKYADGLEQDAHVAAWRKIQFGSSHDKRQRLIDRIEKHKSFSVVDVQRKNFWLQFVLFLR